MVITVAGDKKEVKDAITVSELIVQENVETPQYVTVSVNDDFIDKAEFDTYALKEGDSVEFLYFKVAGIYWHLQMSSWSVIPDTLF